LAAWLWCFEPFCFLNSNKESVQNCSLLKYRGQSLLRFVALCDTHPEKGGRSFLQTAAPKKATGGVTPVAPDTKQARARFLCGRIVAVPEFFAVQRQCTAA
jgi:hypothetical protein